MSEKISLDSSDIYEIFKLLHGTLHHFIYK